MNPTAAFMAALLTAEESASAFKDRQDIINGEGAIPEEEEMRVKWRNRTKKNEMWEINLAIINDFDEYLLENIMGRRKKTIKSVKLLSESEYKSKRQIEKEDKRIL